MVDQRRLIRILWRIIGVEDEGVMNQTDDFSLMVLDGDGIYSVE